MPILTYSSNIASSVEHINASSPKNRVILQNSSAETDFSEEYTYIPTSDHLLCSNNIVAYIAGFIVHKLKKSLHCEACLEGLTAHDDDIKQSLIKMKNKGNLIHPSDDVIKICVQCEILFRKSISFNTNSDISLGRKDF